MHVVIKHFLPHCVIAEDKEELEPEEFHIEVTKEKVKVAENDVKDKELQDDLIVDKKADKDVPLTDNTADDEVKVKDEEKPFVDGLKDKVKVKDTDKVKDTNAVNDRLDDDYYGYKSITELKTPCEELEYERLKNNLLQYHCARIGEMDCTSDPASMYTHQSK